MKNIILKEILELKNKEKYAEAIKKAVSAFKKYKDNCFNNEIYECLVKQGKRKDALKLLKKMLKYQPDDIKINKRLAYNNYVLGKYEEALKYYKIVIELEPLSSDNYLNAGSMYHSIKNYKKAYHYYYTAVRLNPKNISALNNIGILYYETRNWNQAIDIFNKVISIAKEHPEAYYHLGIIEREYKKDLELSELYLKKALRIDNDYSENYYQLAVTQYQANKNENAVENLKKCLKLNPYHTNCQTLLKKLS